MIIFRCDASSSWGMGHLTRCRALAMELKAMGQQVSMIGPSRAFWREGDENLFTHWRPSEWQALSGGSVNEIIKFASLWKADSLVLDDPRVDEAFQLEILKKGIPWLQFDGTGSKPLWANLILNALPSAKESFYSSALQNPKTKLLLGPNYAILRPEFKSIHVHKKRKGNFRIFICTGGGDDRGAIEGCIKSLSPLLGSTITIKIISGKTNPRNHRNIQLISKIGGNLIEYFIEPHSPWEIMASCNLAVISSGTIAHEINFFGLPMILFSIVENQHLPGKSWQEIGQGEYLGRWDSIEERLLFESVLKFIEARNENSLQIRPVVDGMGASRVARAIHSLSLNNQIQESSHASSLFI